MGVSFETCLRRREDVPMRRRCYVLLRRRHDVPIRCRGDVPLRRLGDVPSRRRWVFHLRRTCDVAGTYRETSLRHCHDVLLPGGIQLNYISCSMVCNIVFAPNSPIFGNVVEKKKKEKTGRCKMFCFANKRDELKY